MRNYDCLVFAWHLCSSVGATLNYSGVIDSKTVLNHINESFDRYHPFAIPTRDEIIMTVFDPLDSNDTLAMVNITLEEVQSGEIMIVNSTRTGSRVTQIADKCSDLCDKHDSCLNDPHGHRSYCKSWQNPKVCFGFYWSDPSKKSVCYEPYPGSGKCIETLPVGCDEAFVTTPKPLDSNICVELCMQIPGCVSDPGRHSSYCKKWQKPAVCFGLYWTDSRKTKSCFQPNRLTGHCPERIPVLCDEDSIKHKKRPILPNKSVSSMAGESLTTMIPLNASRNVTTREPPSSMRAASTVLTESTRSDSVDPSSTGSRSETAMEVTTTPPDTNIWSESTRGLDQSSASITSTSRATDSVTSTESPQSSAIGANSVILQIIQSSQSIETIGTESCSSTTRHHTHAHSHGHGPHNENRNTRNGPTTTTSVPAARKPVLVKNRKAKSCQQICDSIESCRGGFGSTCMLNNKNKPACYGLFFTDDTQTKICYALKDTDCPNIFPVPCP